MKNFFSQFTPEQMKKQYAANATGLNEMKNKAITTGKKVNGYTAAELTAHAETYKKLSK